MRNLRIDCADDPDASDLGGFLSFHGVCWSCCCAFRGSVSNLSTRVTCASKAFSFAAFAAFRSSSFATASLVALEVRIVAALGVRETFAFALAFVTFAM
jgi:hypothetical protein